MRLWQARGGPWGHTDGQVYIIEDHNGVCAFAMVKTGEPSKYPWDSERIRDGLLPSSTLVPVDQYPSWADIDLLMDIGL